MTGEPVATAGDSLHRRLLAVSTAFGPEGNARADGSSGGPATLELLAEFASRSADDPSLTWLLMTAVAGSMPTRGEYLRGSRLIDLATPDTRHYALLEACAGMARDNDHLDRDIRLSDSRVVVDVDFTARHGYNTGVQRVVRETVSRWNAEHAVELVAWTEQAKTMRSLEPDERDRVLSWSSERASEISGPGTGENEELVVPWRCTLVLPEVAQERFWERLACLTEFSGNAVVLIGYDTIPITSAQFVVPMESDRFVRYLSVVKSADALVAISRSSAEEFAGFVGALSAQALEGPRVSAVELPVSLPSSMRAATTLSNDHVGVAPPMPLIVCVGTQEPRKNQLAVLAAAESLWKSGQSFELLFIGSAARVLSQPFDRELERLRGLGYPVTADRAATDAALGAAYRRARFTVFVSLHEGFGLPVAESLSMGTPVLTSAFGSMAEIAAGGGCVLVDPHDDSAIFDAMRLMLTDDPLIERLRAETSALPRRSWDDYAREVWEVVASVGRRTPGARSDRLVRYDNAMTNSEPGNLSGADTRQVDILEQRVREAEARTLEYWLEAVTSTSAGSMTVKRLEQSVSWRITKPLRAFRIVQITARRAGLRRTASMVRTRLAQIRQARERG